MKITGEYIRMLRRRYGFSQHELAKRVGVSQAHIAKIESGKVDPRLSTVNKIIDVLENAGMKMKCRDIMTKRVIYARSNDSVMHVIEMMKRHGISQIPVIENGMQIGSITESTLFNSIDIDLSTATVEDIMDDPMPMLSENASIEEAKEMLKFAPGIVVVSGGKIAGIITKSDLLKLRL